MSEGAFVVIRSRRDRVYRTYAPEWRMWGGKIMQQQKCSETGNKKQQWDCENMSPVRLASGFLYHTTDEDFCHRSFLFFDKNSDFVG